MPLSKVSFPPQIQFMAGMLIFAGLGIQPRLAAGKTATPPQGRIVVFQQAGFPTLESRPVTRADLATALKGEVVAYADLRQLRQPATLTGARLLILPYGSAAPASAWAAILAYLRQGGNLLTLGGRALMMPVYQREGKFVPGRVAAAYARALGFEYSYAAPRSAGLHFAWSRHAPSFHPLALDPRRVFVLASEGGGAYHGLGFLEDAGGKRLAAPVTRVDFDGLGRRAALRGDRCVFLNFTPAYGFWHSAAGRQLIRDAADYARRGATVFMARMRLATITPKERPELSLRLRYVLAQRQGGRMSPAFRNAGLHASTVRITTFTGHRQLASLTRHCLTASCAITAPLPATPRPGFYRVYAQLRQDGRVWETERLGYWQRDRALLASGEALTAGRHYLHAGGKPFFPVGANYFSTAWYGGGFDQGNALAWERDMAEMEQRGVNFIRTGVWFGQSQFLNPLGGANLQFRRGLEAFLLSAARHRLQVNFTFTAFNPRIASRPPHAAGRNPYLNPAGLQAELNYYRSLVRPFRRVPFLSWDLINEPSFSNPLAPWQGNIPNNDPVERHAWEQWLHARYRRLSRLARAWNTTPQALGSWRAIPLPSPADLKPARYGNFHEDRAFDYNLFAQAQFSRWVATMVAAIRATGSRQLIDVGQDEGGVTNRVLDAFFGQAGVSFTVNHTYWQDNALLWDALVSHAAGRPDFVGETGVQPAWRADNAWRWNEFSAAGLMERKLALGLAAGSSGALLWDWGNGDEFGIKRRDGSEKIWAAMLGGVADFGRRLAPYATGARRPETAIVLPQSLQLSVFNDYAIRAQQHAVRSLYDYARGTAYAIGEYQLDGLGNPRLIIVPSPWVFSRAAWGTLLGKVKAGATLLISGRFDLDAHFHATRRPHLIGLDYTPQPLAQRMMPLRWPGGAAWLSYPGEDTNYLEYGALPGGKTFQRLAVGKGQVLYFAPPLEMNANYRALGQVYEYALRQAGVKPLYRTHCDDPGITIAPTPFAQATLYVVTSESAAARQVSWVDRASGKRLETRLAPGRAALALVSRTGQLLASYNWRP